MATDLREVAEAHAAFFTGRAGSDLAERWVETVWSPDIEIRVNSVDQVRTRDDWIASHSPPPAAAGRESSGTAASAPPRRTSRVQIDRVHVTVDSFVLQGSIAGGSDARLPLCLVFAVSDGVVVRMDEYIGMTVPTAPPG